MKKYRVKVNGKLYEVELEAVEEVKGTIVPEAKKTISSLSSGASENFLAPIGGKVLDIKVNIGSSVKKGDVLCIIEAMKLENEVKATKDCVIKEIKASKGAIVANKDVLFVIG